MKKVMVLIAVLAMVLALAFTGCCTRIDQVSKASTKTFSNCLATAQDILCNPTPAQQATAASVLAFITSGIDIANIIVPVPITAAEVQLVFGLVQNGGCILATDLQKALAWYASITATLQAESKAGKARGLKAVAAMPPNVDVLYNW